jgi:hypothetical protein
MFQAHLEPSYWAVMVRIDERGEWAESQRTLASWALSRWAVSPSTLIPDPGFSLDPSFHLMVGSAPAGRSSRF